MLLCSANFSPTSMSLTTCSCAVSASPIPPNFLYHSWKKQQPSLLPSYGEEGEREGGREGGRKKGRKRGKEEERKRGREKEREEEKEEEREGREGGKEGGIVEEGEKKYGGGGRGREESVSLIVK